MQALASGGVALYIANAATAGSGSAFVAATVQSPGTAISSNFPGVESSSTIGLTTTVTTTVTNTQAGGIGSYVSTGVADPSTGTNFYGGSGGSIASNITAPIINAPPPPKSAPASTAPAQESAAPTPTATTTSSEPAFYGGGPTGD